VERYIWAATILLVAIIASGTVLVMTGHSGDVRSLAILTAQGIGFVLNYYVAWRASQNTTNRVSRAVHESKEEVKEAVNGIGKSSSETG
jgi:hypothetical protein